MTDLPASPIADLSAYVIAGRVTPQPSDQNETAARTPAQGIHDGVDAENIGFRRVFLSERWNLKEAGVILGAIAARTTRIDVATGVLTPAARHPLHAAALGSTIHAAFGPRFVLGIGRGDNEVLNSQGLSATRLADFEQYVNIIRALWAGETVSYDGPLGRYPELCLGDRHDGPDPKIWLGTFGLPGAATVAAVCADGVLLVPNLTPEASASSVKRIRDACEQIGRDPASIHIAQCVITAPALDETETAQIADARLLTYIEAPGYRKALARVNGWSLDEIAEITAHKQLQTHGAALADAVFHRSQLVDAARRIPREWINETCALGSVSECVAQLERFRDAGADELVTYGSTPAQNAALADAWRQLPRISAREKSK